MLIGYVRVSKTDGSKSTNLQRDALVAEPTAGRVAIHILDCPGKNPEH